MKKTIAMTDMQSIWYDNIELITKYVNILKESYPQIDDTSECFVKILTEIGDGASIADIQDELIDFSRFYIGIRNSTFEYGNPAVEFGADEPLIEFGLRNIFSLHFEDEIRQLPLDTYFFNGGNASTWKLEASSYRNLYHNLTSPVAVTDTVMNAIGELLHVNLYPIMVEKIDNPDLKLLHYDPGQEKIVEITANINDFTPPINEYRMIFNSTYPSKC